VAFIEVSDLVREFRSYRRFSGPLGPIRSLFTRQYDVRRALDGVSFTIERVATLYSRMARGKGNLRRAQAHHRALQIGERADRRRQGR